MITLKRLQAPTLKHLRDVDLWFPRRGATLIEGPNESGKSTLFEAVYFALFGRPLVGEEPGKATLAALIPHGGTQAHVTLTVATGEVDLEVTRSIGRARNGSVTSEASLVVRGPDAREERISAVSAVNERIIAELRGLDSDTMRNSCFMEQKGLERLESLRREDREEAISRLLGLERLVAVERDLTPTTEDRRQLETLRAQTRVAEERRRLQVATARQTDVAQRLDAAETRAYLDERDSLLARIDEWDRRRDELSAESEGVTEALNRLATLLSAERRLAESERTRWRTREAKSETERLTAQLRQIDALELGRAPEIRQQVAVTRRLEADLRSLAAERRALEDDGRSIRRAQVSEESWRQTNEELARAREERVAAWEAFTQARSRASLEEWMTVRERTDLRLNMDAQLARAEQQRAQIEASVRETNRQSLLWLSLAASSAVLAIVSILLTFATNVGELWMIVVMASVAAAGLAWRWQREVGQRRQLAWKAEQQDDVITHLRVEVNLTRRLKSDDMVRLEANLRAAGVRVPANMSDAEAMLRELPASEEFDIAAERLREADIAVAHAQATVNMLNEARNGRAPAAPRYAPAPASRPTAAPAFATVRLEDVAEREARLKSEAQALGLPDDLPALAAARGAAEATLAALTEALPARAEVQTRLLSSSEEAANVARSWADSLLAIARELARAGALDAAPEAPVEVPVGEDGVVDVAPLEQERDRLDRAAKEALRSLDEYTLRERQATLRTEMTQGDERQEKLAEEAARVRGAVREVAARHEVNARGDESLEELIAFWPLLAEVSAEEREELRTAHDHTRLEVYHSEQAAASDQANLPAEDANAASAADEAKARLEAAERDLRRRQLAAQLIAEARSRLIRQALPETEIYMRAILPQLTAGRYHDITLMRDDNAGSDMDMAIRMWDQMAGRYVRKNLFSGGTRDQASLALRLAFALATLPKERGATPGFLFLDEPLSAFDNERSIALTRILTTGAIAEAFAQIFLISHSQVVDAHSFDYSLRMEGGRIAETTLPRGAMAEALWMAEDKVGVSAHVVNG